MPTDRVKSIINSSKFLRSMVEGALDMIIVIDKYHNIIMFNKAAKSRFGYMDDQIIGKNIDIVYANASGNKHVFDAMKNTGQFHGEIINVDNKGESFISRLSASALYSDNGEYIGAVGISRDITEYRKASIELSKSERRFRELSDLIPVAIVEFDLDGIVNYSNKTGLGLFGYSMDSINSGDINIKDIIKKSQLNVAFERIDAIVTEDNVSSGYEYEFMKEDGTMISCLAYGSPIHDNCGNVIGVRSAVTDITAVKEAEKEVRRKDASINAIVTTVIDSIIIINVKGEVVFWNNAAEDMFGYKSEEVVGKTLEFIMPYRYKAGHASAVGRLSKEPNGSKHIIGESIELYGLRKDGTEFPLELSLSSWGTNGSSFFTGILRDTTERKEAEHALQRRDDILQAVSYTADKFLSSDNWENNIEEILEEIGIATDVSRVHLYKNNTKDGVVLASQLYEWCGYCVISSEEIMKLKDIDVVSFGFERWLDIVKGGTPFFGLVKDFPENEQKLYNITGILSVLILPIMIDDVLWGFMAFNEEKTERIWDPVVIDALKIVTRTLEAGIKRDIRVYAEERENRRQWERAEEHIYNTNVHTLAVKTKEAKEKLFEAVNAAKGNSNFNIINGE